MAIRFDAATDRITYSASNPPDPASGITIAFWTYISVDQNTDSTMLRLHQASGSTTVLNLAMGGDGQTPNIFTVGGSVTSPTTCTAAAYYYVVVTVTGTTGTIYVTDYATSTTTSASGTINTVGQPTGLTVGGRSASDATESYNGRMALLRYWSVVLSGPERDAERVSTVPVRTADLWSDWPFPDDTDLTDHVAGHNFVAGSTAVTTEASPVLNATVNGTAAGPLGSLTASATGSRVVAGTATAPLAGVTASAAGVPTVSGTGTAPLAGLTASATGRRTVAGSAAAALAGLAASGSGRPTVLGHLVGPLGALAASATGKRTVVGLAAAPLTYSSTSAGRRTRHGIAVAALGSLTAQGTATGATHDIRLAASVPASRRWRTTVAAQS